MKPKSVLMLLGLLIILSIPSASLAEEPGDINYNRTEFKFGQTVYFNMGDKFCAGDPFDQNNFMHPHVFDSPNMKRGIFINVKDYGFPPGGTTAYRVATIAYVDKYGEGGVITQQVENWLPQQRTIIFNW